MGERRQRLYILQPPEGGAHAAGGGHATPRRDSSTQAEPLLHLCPPAHSRGVAEFRTLAERAPAYLNRQGGYAPSGESGSSFLTTLPKGPRASLYTT